MVQVEIIDPIELRKGDELKITGLSKPWSLAGVNFKLGQLEVADQNGATATFKVRPRVDFKTLAVGETITVVPHVDDPAKVYAFGSDPSHDLVVVKGHSSGARLDLV